MSLTDRMDSKKIEAKNIEILKKQLKERGYSPEEIAKEISQMLGPKQPRHRE